MITLLILGGAATLAALVAGVSLRRKKGVQASSPAVVPAAGETSATAPAAASASEQVASDAPTFRGAGAGTSRRKKKDRGRGRRSGTSAIETNPQMTQMSADEIPLAIDDGGPSSDNEFEPAITASEQVPSLDLRTSATSADNASPLTAASDDSEPLEPSLDLPLSGTSAIETSPQMTQMSADEIPLAIDDGEPSPDNESEPMPITVSDQAPSLDLRTSATSADNAFPLIVDLPLSGTTAFETSPQMTQMSADEIPLVIDDGEASPDNESEPIPITASEQAPSLDLRTSATSADNVSPPIAANDDAEPLAPSLDLPLSGTSAIETSPQMTQMSADEIPLAIGDGEPSPDNETEPSPITASEQAPSLDLRTSATSADNAFPLIVDLPLSGTSAIETSPQMTQMGADETPLAIDDGEPSPDNESEPMPITASEQAPSLDLRTSATSADNASPPIAANDDAEPLPQAEPEQAPSLELHSSAEQGFDSEPQPLEPAPTPAPPPITVAAEHRLVSFKTYRTKTPRPVEPVRAPARPRPSRIIREPKSERKQMSRIVKGGLIQTSLACDTSEPLDKIRQAQTERTIKYIDQAGAEGVQILCMQEIFTGPYFCAEQTTRWYDSTEKIPDGPTTVLMQEYAKKYNMVIVVPLYEVEETGVYYNTAAVIDADGKYLGKYRKNHIPHVAPGFWEKFYFRPGNLGYPVFETAYAKVGVYICYDRHFPEGARELGLAGAEIVMNPSATVAGLSEYLWKLEQPAHAVANGYFIGAINRVGFEAPWNIGEFYGQSYFCDPRGQMLNVGPRDADALVTADLDLDKIREVRNTWQFYRDRRPETYTGIVRL